MEWYDNIELPIRDVVRLLRNNGWNTICSCGHEMKITIDIFPIRHVNELEELLKINGYKHYSIEEYTTTDNRLWVFLHLPYKITNNTIYYLDYYYNMDLE